MAKMKSMHDAIMKQIRFHKTVVNACGPRYLFQETVNRISQTTDQLICNLKTILELNDGDSVEDTSVKFVYNDLNTAEDSINVRG